MILIIFFFVLKINLMKNFRSFKRVKKNNYRCFRFVKIDISLLGVVYRVI